jgi:hypothetical protein
MRKRRGDFATELQKILRGQPAKPFRTDIAPTALAIGQSHPLGTAGVNSAGTDLFICHQQSARQVNLLTLGSWPLIERDPDSMKWARELMTSRPTMATCG